MSEHDEHSSFIKTPQQLVTVVVLAFLVPIIGIVLLVKYVVGAPKADTNALNPEAVAKASRDFYPVRNTFLEVPGLRIRIHEATGASVVYEVTKDDNAYKKKP